MYIDYNHSTDYKIVIDACKKEVTITFTVRETDSKEIGMSEDWGG